ncbi:MAG: alkaline phosphatase family protein [Betaproteobacteria bacterium]|nr:alkaline phosphatase family protein [Betaproteobacteria bacterium]
MKFISTLRTGVALLCLSLSMPLLAAELRAGPMAGASYMRGAKLWLQASGPSKAVVEYWDVQQPKKILATPPLPLKADEDFVGHFAIGGLEPGNTYGYRVKLDGKLQDVKQSLIFRTQTLWQWRTDAPDWKLALGSCAYTNEVAYDRPGVPYGGPPSAMAIYDSIARQKPDAMLWTGDVIYYRETDWDSLWGMRYRWRHDRAAAELQSLLRTGHHFAIWDDHDYGPNDSTGAFVRKGDSLALFKRYFANPDYGLPETPGVFGNFTFNDAEIFLTDNRYYRDSDWLQDADRAMLGAAQLRWLKNSLVASTAPIKLVVMGSQVTNDLNRRESWHMFPRERDDFLKFLIDHKINGVMLLTGDRHFTELLKTERPGSYPLYELTCSPLTSGVGSDAKAEAANVQIVPGTFVAERNFCTIEFSGPRRQRKLTMKSFSTEGKQLWEKQIALSELRSPN